MDDKIQKQPKPLHAIYWEDAYWSFTGFHISFLASEAENKKNIWETPQWQAGR